MPKTYILDKAFKVGTLYRSEPDKYYVIEKVGTNSTTAKAQLKVAGAPCLELLDKIAPIGMRDVHRFPLLELGPLFCVIPRDKPFDVAGDTGTYLRAQGRTLELGPGEVEATSDLARFGEQARKLLTYLQGDKVWAGAGSWAADEEHKLIEQTVPAGEKWRINRFAHVERLAALAAKVVGQISIRVYINDAPLDLIDKALAPMGIDTVRGHWYADTTSYLMPFNLAEMPLELPPGKKIGFYARNISGSAITTAANDGVRMTLLLEKELV